MVVESGEVFQVRHFQRAEVSAVYAARFVRADGDGVWLWTPAGSRHWFPFMPDGREMRQTPLPEWFAADKPWSGWEQPHSVLSWYPAGAPYAIQWYFGAEGFRNWYANLQEPAVDWAEDGIAGLDTVDWDLDVWIGPDRTWHWKDEQDMADRLAFPDQYWVDDPRPVRAAGAEVVGLVESGAFPFDGTACDFRPGPDWNPVVADAPPLGWDRPRHVGPHGHRKTAN
jgi:hypothetical protein